jgi:Integrase core domain
LPDLSYSPLGPLSIGGLPAPSCSRRPASRLGSPYRRLPFGGQADSKAPTDLIPDNGIVERFHKTMLDEFYRIVFRKKLYKTIEDLQADLDLWMREFNEARPHQGKWCFGKTPAQTFLDALPLAREKSLQVAAAGQPNAA